MLLCYSVTVLLVLLVLLCYCVTVLLCYCVIVLLCYSVTVLLCYCYCVTVTCVTVLLCYCVTVLLQHHGTPWLTMSHRAMHSYPSTSSSCSLDALTVVNALRDKTVTQIHAYNGCEHTLCVTQDGHLYAFGYVLVIQVVLVVYLPVPTTL